MSTSWIVFVCVFGGALLGMFLQAILPERHLSTESRGALNLVIGLIGTMAAIVLGLLVATAHGTVNSYRWSANVILADRMLGLYGPETKEARELLQGAVTR